MARKPASVAEYLQGVSPAQRRALQRLRRLVSALVPDAEEKISYGIPVFRTSKLLIGYGAWSTHCAIYALSGTLQKKFAKELAGYDCGKGTIRFAPERPLPDALVKKLVKARLAELLSRRP